MAASFGGHVDTLIETKAEVNVQKKVLHHNVVYMQHVHVPVYLWYNVSVWVCPQDGWTALHLAAHKGKLDVVRLLTEAHAQVNIQTKV